VGKTAEDRARLAGQANEPDSLDALRGTLVERLRARSHEVEEAIVSAALSIEPLADGDVEGLAGLRASARETVELIVELIEQGESWSPRLPSAVAAQIRHLARAGVPLDSVVRGYYATTSLCFEFATTEIEDLPEETLPYLVSIQSKHGDYLMRTVTAEYEDELALLDRSPSKRRLEERLRRLLGGETVDTSGLDYDFGQWHLGMIAVGADADLVARRLAEQLGCRLLFLPRGTETAWVWLGAAREIPFAELERAMATVAGEDAAFAAGEPRSGIDGWRLSHREAQAALEVMRRRPQRLVRCSDVVLLATALRDDEARRILVDAYLGPIDSRRDGAVLRDTLRSYFASGGNAASAAASLGVDRHTVHRRLRRAEEALGRTLDSCWAEMDVALRVEELTG
jgi:hypothetical protein